jgi:hypothetical protein
VHGLCGRQDRLHHEGWPARHTPLDATSHRRHDGQWVYVTGQGRAAYNAFGNHRDMRVEVPPYTWNAVFRFGWDEQGLVVETKDSFVGEASRDPKVAGAGSDNDHLDAPQGLACDASGRLYIADFNNHRIQVFSADGEHLKTIPCQQPHERGVVRIYGDTGTDLVLLQDFREEVRKAGFTPHAMNGGHMGYITADPVRGHIYTGRRDLRRIDPEEGKTWQPLDLGQMPRTNYGSIEEVVCGWDGMLYIRNLQYIARFNPAKFGAPIVLSADTEQPFDYGEVKSDVSQRGGESGGLRGVISIPFKRIVSRISQHDHVGLFGQRQRADQIGGRLGGGAMLQALLVVAATFFGPSLAVAGAVGVLRLASALAGKCGVDEEDELPLAAFHLQQGHPQRRVEVVALPTRPGQKAGELSACGVVGFPYRGSSP